MNKKSKIMRILLALSSLVCTNAFAAPGAQSLVLQKGFGAAGDFVFTTIAGLHSTCELKANDTALTIYACLNPPGNDCSVIDNIISTPKSLGSKSLGSGLDTGLFAKCIP